MNEEEHPLKRKLRVAMKKHAFLRAVFRVARAKLACLRRGHIDEFVWEFEGERTFICTRCLRFENRSNEEKARSLTCL